MNRSLWSVLLGTFTLRFSTGLTGLMLAYYLAELSTHQRPLDELLGLGQGVAVGAIGFALISATFYASELILSPAFGVVSDRLGHWRVMQVGPLLGMVAVVITWATTNLPLITGTRLLEGSATAASVPSILGFIAATTSHDEGLRGRAVARFEAATLAGLLGGFVAAGPLYSLFGPTAFLLNGVMYGVSLAIYRYGVDPGLDAQPDLEAPERRRGVDLSRYRRILGHSHVWLLAPTWIAINAVLGLFTTQTIFQLVREPDPKFADQLLMGGFEPLQISIGLAIGGALFFAGLIYWGNRFKSLRRTTIILYGLGGGGLLVAAAMAINHSGGLPMLARLPVAVPAFLGLFVLAGATPAAIGLLADVTEAYPEDRGAIMGLYSVFLGLGQISGSLIAGLAAAAMGLDGILIASVALLGLALIPLGYLRRYEHYLGGPGEPATVD
jgi:MFS family permease